MKRILLAIFLIACLSFQASALNPVMMQIIADSATFDCSPYDICQNFEGAGYDNSETWNETVGDGTIDEDYAVSPLVGSQSLRMVDGGANSDVEVNFGPHADGATTYAYFRMRVDVDLDGDETIFRLNDGASPCLALILKASSGALSLYHGSVGDAGSTDVSGGGKFHVWVDWKTENGTSTDGIAHLFVSSNGTKPAAEATVTTGDANQPGVDTVIFLAAGGSLDWVIDKVLVDDSAIGNQ